MVKDKTKFVEVITKFDVCGNITPLTINWEDGTVYEVDSVVAKKNVPSLKSGGIASCIYRNRRKADLRLS